MLGKAKKARQRESDRPGLRGSGSHLIIGKMSGRSVTIRIDGPLIGYGPAMGPIGKSGDKLRTDRAPELEARPLARERKFAGVASRLRMTEDELLERLDAALPAIPDSPESAIPVAERDALRRAGVNLAGPEGDPTGVAQLTAGIARVNEFRAAALSVAQAAARLGVSQGRVRQQIRAREVASLPSNDGTHQLPAWQFLDDRLVPGLGTVLPQADGVHPLTLAHFMTRPDPDLVVDGDPVAPVEWLAGGGNADLVADLVAGLHLAA